MADGILGGLGVFLMFRSIPLSLVMARDEVDKNAIHRATAGQQIDGQFAVAYNTYENYPVPSLDSGAARIAGTM